MQQVSASVIGVPAELPPTNILHTRVIGSFHVHNAVIFDRTMAHWRWRLVRQQKRTMTSTSKQEYKTVQYPISLDDETEEGTLLLFGRPTASRIMLHVCWVSRQSLVPDCPRTPLCTGWKLCRRHVFARTV